MANNPFNVPDELPSWLDMGNTQQSDFANQIAPSLDVLKLKVGQMRNKQGGAGGALGGALNSEGGLGKAGGMKPESL